MRILGPILYVMMSICGVMIIGLMLRFHWWMWDEYYRCHEEWAAESEDWREGDRECYFSKYLRTHNSPWNHACLKTDIETQNDVLFQEQADMTGKAWSTYMGIGRIGHDHQKADKVYYDGYSAGGTLLTQNR